MTDVIIRDAEEKDAEHIRRLLRQVLEVHASVRPDIFIPGTAKYTVNEVKALIKDAGRRSYVADCDGDVLGYALCVIKEPEDRANTVPSKTLYIDDLCVDEAVRERHIGARLFEHVKAEAKRLGCRYVTLNVWDGNGAARAFYDKMGLKPRLTQMELKIDENV